MLRALTEIDGVSGFEDEVRKFIKGRTAYKPNEDALGNLWFNEGHDLCLFAHMDEIGFMISGSDGGGFLKFKRVGGIDEKILLGKCVNIGKDKVPGIIGSQAVHLKKDGADNGFYIDIGAKSKLEAKKYIGEYAVFESEYRELRNDRIKAKALDDRAGCAVLLELLSENIPATVCFTAQEEVGTRGSTVLARRLKPKYALVIESTFALDSYGVPEKEYVTHLGGGPAITIMDGSVITDREFTAKIAALAEENGIPYQYKKSSAGGTDAGAVRMTGAACAVLSLPCRNLHTGVSVMDRTDFMNLKKLARIIVLQLQCL